MGLFVLEVKGTGRGQGGRDASERARDQVKEG